MSSWSDISEAQERLFATHIPTVKHSRGYPKRGEFLQLTACMSEEYRNKIAKLEILKMLLPQSEFAKIIEGFLLPAMQLLGHAGWVRYVIDDEGLFVGRLTVRRRGSIVIPPSDTEPSDEPTGDVERT